MSPLKAALLSPLVILAAAPLYAVWLLYQYTSQFPISPAAWRVVLNLSLLSAAIGLALGYTLIFAYGLAIRSVLERSGSSWVGWFVITGAVPGLLFLLTSYSWQESVVPGVLFGVIVAVMYWFFAVRQSGNVR